MAFIVKKKINGKEYYYLNETKRINGKVKTKTLAYLDKSKKEAEKKAKEIIKNLNKNKKEVIQDKISEMEKKDITINELSVFCKRKGFVYQSGEIYGGLAGFWDFGHLGVELKNNIKKEWWNYHVYQRDDVVGIDGSIITHPKVWEASGHVGNFNDFFVVCKNCKKPGKIAQNEFGKIKCECGGEYDIANAKKFDLMFKTNVGESGEAFLRPETAQLIFSNFKSVYENARMKLPFGIAQSGKAFRNEIAPRDFLFRSREFEQMELQFFVDPNKINDYPYYNKIEKYKIKILTASAQEDKGEESFLSISEMVEKGIFKNKWHAYWLYNSYKWFLDLGIDEKNLRLREHRKDELSHYAKSAVDIEYKFSFGWKEIFGSHDRGQFDLGEHEKFSKKDMKVLDEETGEKILPNVIEASFGVERAFLVFMSDSYFYDKARENIILKLNPKLSPIKAAVFPIVKKKEFEKLSEEIVAELKKEFNVVYDKSGSIGRRYARNDEAGTPYCITIDDESLIKKNVTVRWRDTGEQVRIKIKDLKDSLRKSIDGESILNLGKLVNTRKK